MGFSTPAFLFVFLPLSLLLYVAAGAGHSRRLQNAVLLVLSLLFYAWCGIQYLLLLCTVVLVNFYASRFLSLKAPGCLAGLVTFDLLVLGIFKYFNFFAENLARAASTLCGREISFSVPDVPLPLGISFVVFTLIAYAVDVAQGEPAETNLVDYALYIFLFPKLLEGPITRYRDLRPALKERTASPTVITNGLRRFICGFAKKVLIADQLALFSDTVFSLSPSVLTPGEAWLGALTYAFVIFFDFSGYSDMAIGLCAVFGFSVAENFDYPYISKTIQEFWRRWHISLSSWFRDYVYIPLGGNRKGTLCTYRNLVIVFLLTGLWHGASWNFIVWGCFHGVFQLLERVGLKKLLKKLPPVFGHAYCMLVVTVGWVFFRAADLTQAGAYLGTMFRLSAGSDSSASFLSAQLQIMRQITPEFIFFFVLAAVLSTPLGRWAAQRLHGRGESLVKNAVCLVLFVLAAASMLASTYSPSIYTKF